MYTGLSEFAGVKEDGMPVRDREFPFALLLMPEKHLNDLQCSPFDPGSLAGQAGNRLQGVIGSDTKYDYNPLNSQLQSIKVPQHKGTNSSRFFTVYAVHDPDDEPIQIGELRLDSPFF